MKKSLEIRTKKNKSRKQINYFKKLLFWLLFLAFGGAVGWTLLFSPALKVKKITVKTKTIDKIKIETVAKEELIGSRWKFFSADNLLLIKRCNIKRRIQDEFLLAKQASVKMKFPDQLMISVLERQFVAVWCGKEGCWWIDETGTIFRKIENQLPITAAQQENTVVLRNTGQTETARVGEKVIDSSLVSFSRQLFLEAENRSSMKLKRELQIPSSIANEVWAITDRGWRIYFSVDEPIEKELAILEKALEKNISPAEQQQLEYIDLRLKGKVVYKTKQVIEPTEEEPTKRKGEEDNEEVQN